MKNLILPIGALLIISSCSRKPKDIADLTRKDYYNMYYLEEEGRAPIDPDTIYAVTFKKKTGYLNATLYQKDVELLHSFKNLLILDITKDGPGPFFLDSIDFKKLPNLQRITGYQSYPKQHFIDKIAESTSITELFIAGISGIDSIPAYLCKNKNMEELTIKRVNKIPPCIADMNIKKLTFYPKYTGGYEHWFDFSFDKVVRKLFNDTTTVTYKPQEAVHLDNITPLTIKSLDSLIYYPGRSDSLPPDIKHLKSLRYLKIEGRINSIPEEINELTNLEVLQLDGYLHENDYPITKFPESLSGLKNLKTLSINNYSLEGFPPITTLHNLKHLILNEVVGIDSIPDDIENLKNLEAFLIKESGYKEFYNDYGWKTNKTMEQYVASFDSLDLSDNIYNFYGYYGYGSSIINPFYYVTNRPTITYLSPNIGKLTKLKWFGLENVAIEELPESIGNLTNLKYFNTSNSYLKTLPESFSRLSPVILNLRNNQLVSLPDASRVGKYDYAELQGNLLSTCEAFKFWGNLALRYKAYKDTKVSKRDRIHDSLARVSDQQCLNGLDKNINYNSLYPQNEKTKLLREKASIKYLEYQMFGWHKEYFEKLNIH